MEFEWVRRAPNATHWRSKDGGIQVFLYPVKLLNKKETVIVTVIVPDIYVRNKQESYRDMQFSTMKEAQAWVETMVITGALA